MIKGLLEKLSLTTVFITFFFVCGGLYLIGFWTTFGVDVTSFVSLTDIPKSFVLPFVLAQGFYLFNLMTTIISSRDFIDDMPKNTDPPKNIWMRLLRVFTSLDMIFFVVVIVILSNYGKHNLSISYWSLSALAVSWFLTVKTANSEFLKTNIQYYNVRFYVANILCFLPISCFATGKIAALNIYNNKDVRYVNIINENSESENRDMNFSRCDSSCIKFVGFLGDKIIVSSLDNEKIFFINQSSFSTVELSKKPKP